MEWWIDIPKALFHGLRQPLCDPLAALDGQSVIMMNTGIGDGADQPKAENWPTDLIAIETLMPQTSASTDSHNGHQPWRQVLRKDYRIPGEACDTECKRGFHRDAGKGGLRRLGSAALLVTPPVA